MAITHTQALALRTGDELHYGECNSSRSEVWFVIGELRFRKSSPDDFLIPVWNDPRSFGHLTERNAPRFHRAEDCLAKEKNHV